MRAIRASTRSPRGLSIAVLGTFAVLAIAFDGGGYGLGARVGVSVVVWWAIFVICITSGSISRFNRACVWSFASFAAFVAWIGLSTLWSSNREASFDEFGRGLLYLGVFALVALVANRGLHGSVLDALAVAIAVVGISAISTRLFPSLASGGSTLTFLPGSLKRLSYPLNYWNGLAIFIAMGVPLLMRGAVVWKPLLARAAAIAALPPLVGAVYLTSSRGGFAALACGVAVFAVCTDRRWIVVGGLLAGGMGGAAAIKILYAHPRLVDGPFTGRIVSEQGHRAALAIALVAVATGAAFLVLIWAGRRVPHPSRSVEWGLSGAMAAVVLLGLVLAHPIRRLDTFTQPPPVSGSSQLLQDHLLSGGGTGRWQLWSSAVQQADDHLIAGGGAGTFGEWWSAHGTLSLFVRDAHSLYLETFGELGLIGLALLLGAFTVGVVGALRRFRGESNRAATAAAIGGFTAYCLGAGIDWMWELTVVSVVGIALLAVLATAGGVAAELRPVRPPLRLVLAVLAVLVVGCSVLPWIVQSRLGLSADAAAGGDLRTAYADALGAGRLEPWAATPDVQAALVAEQAHDLALAQRLITRAIAHDRNNWSLWYIRARILAAAGHSRAARRDLQRSLALNPKSTVLAGAISQVSR